MFLSCSSEDQNQLIVALDVESLVRVSELTTFRLTVVISLLPQHTLVFCSTQLQDGMGDILTPILQGLILRDYMEV